MASRREIAEKIESTEDPCSREDFSNIISEVLDLDDIEAIDVAETLSVTPPTVGRWASGEVCPLKSMRKVALEIIRERLL